MSTELLNLGPLYVSDFLASGEAPRSEPYPLRLMMDDDGLVHLDQQPPFDLMWGERYWYRSGTNASMYDALGDVVRSVTSRVGLGLGEHRMWVDIASNDGTLLSQVPRHHTRIGVDPANDSFTKEAAEHGTIIRERFTSSVAADMVADYGRAKIITCIAMLYDLPDPSDFLEGVAGLLADDGIAVFQMSYTPLMLNQLAFDNICHEHARYYTLQTLIGALNPHGLIVRDVELNDVNGGSFRVYVSRDSTEGWGTRPQRDVAEMRVAALLEYEDGCGFNTLQPWRRFALRLAELRSAVRGFIETVVADGKTVWGYGASTKGNTLLQYFGLDHQLIQAIAERQPGKWDLHTVGTNIPILPEDMMREARPDYLLMLPWHFVAEFTKREAGYLANGGHFIVPCPTFEVIGR